MPNGSVIEELQLRDQVVDMMSLAHINYINMNENKRESYANRHSRKIGELLAGRTIFIEPAKGHRDIRLAWVDPFNGSIPSLEGYREDKYLRGDFFRAVVQEGALLINRKENTQNFSVTRYYMVPIVGSDSEKIEFSVQAS